MSAKVFAMTTYASTLDAADRLSLEEQEQLAATLRQRIAERRREALVAAVRDARTEFSRGRVKPVSASTIAKLIKS
jgi:hypothetical protein